MRRSLNVGIAVFCAAFISVSSAARSQEAAKPADAPKPAAPAAAAPAPASPAAAPAAPSAAAVGNSDWSAEVAPSGGSITLDSKQTDAIKKVGEYFNALSTLKGTFVQVATDQKKMKGKFYMKRPGRFRFDYSSPSKQVIISDGQYLAIQDLDLQNEDRVSLDDTPFRMLLKKDVDLVRDAKIIEVQEGDDRIVLGLQDKSPDTPGRIKLTLMKQPQLELKEWETVDAQGLTTQVIVGDLAKGTELEAGLFEIKPVEFMKKTP